MHHGMQVFQLCLPQRETWSSLCCMYCIMCLIMCFMPEGMVFSALLCVHLQLELVAWPLNAAQGICSLTFAGVCSMAVQCWLPHLQLHSMVLLAL